MKVTRRSERPIVNVSRFARPSAIFTPAARYLGARFTGDGRHAQFLPSFAAGVIAPDGAGMYDGPSHGVSLYPCD